MVRIHKWKKWKKEKIIVSKKVAVQNCNTTLQKCTGTYNFLKENFHKNAPVTKLQHYVTKMHSKPSLYSYSYWEYWIWIWNKFRYSFVTAQILLSFVLVAAHRTAGVPAIRQCIRHCIIIAPVPAYAGMSPAVWIRIIKFILIYTALIPSPARCGKWGSLNARLVAISRRCRAGGLFTRLTPPTWK